MPTNGKILFFYRSLLCTTLVFLVINNIYGFEIHGFVKDIDTTKPISGTQIYELYKDEPVAITDNNGEFKYETGSSAPVEIHAEKKGYYQNTATPRITKDYTQQVEFGLREWYTKNSPFKIYTILKNNPDCILNHEVNMDSPENTVNGYTRLTLNPQKNNSSKLIPNSSDGSITIPHLTPTMSFFKGQWHGGVAFLQEPDTDVYYYHVPQELIDKYIDSRESWFNLDKSQGKLKQYNNFDEYKIEYMKSFYKYCPSKLTNLEQTTQKNNIQTNEQSLANRGLTALTTAAIGISGMELAKGLAEQKADQKAEQDMNSYISSFYCEYGNTKSIKYGTKSTELPGGNNPEITKLRNEYFNLATSLKKRKESLNLKPGIESEIIQDKSQLGLYDDKNTGITNGVYTSLYRAQMGNESDKNKLQEMKDLSKKRVIGGAIAGATGVAVGIIGNSIINNQDTNTQNNIQNQNSTPWEPEPTQCSYSECLSKLTISERTKKKPYYNKITDFCSKRFPSNPDCIKIMLMYSRNPVLNTDVDILLANSFNIDIFKQRTAYHCDDICTDNILFRDEADKYEEAVTHNYLLKTNLEKCFKTAEALNYFDLPLNIYGYNHVEVDIDFTKLDCHKLDDDKTDNALKVSGMDVTNYLKEIPDPLTFWHKIQTLFGKQSNLIHIKQNN